MEMSYNHAWTLIRNMNRHFKLPLVEATRGAGGSQVTPTGERVLALYQEMTDTCLKVTKPQWTALRNLLVREGE